MWSGNAGSFIPSLASLRNSTLNTAGLSPPSGPICNRSKIHATLSAWGRKKDKRAKQIPGRRTDLQKFLDAIQANCRNLGDGARLIVITAVVSGLRVSEVLGLCPVDVDAQAETLRVERRWRRGDEDEPKTEASRRVRQIGSLAGELLEHAASNQRKKHEYIFFRKGGRPLDDRDLQRDVLRPAAEAAGIYFEGFGMTCSADSM